MDINLLEFFVRVRHVVLAHPVYAGLGTTLSMVCDPGELFNFVEASEWNHVDGRSESPCSTVSSDDYSLGPSSLGFSGRFSSCSSVYGESESSFLPVSDSDPVQEIPEWFGRSSEAFYEHAAALDVVLLARRQCEVFARRLAGDMVLGGGDASVGCFLFARDLVRSAELRLSAIQEVTFEFMGGVVDFFAYEARVMERF